MAVPDPYAGWSLSDRLQMLAFEAEPGPLPSSLIGAIWTALKRLDALDSQSQRDVRVAAADARSISRADRSTRENGDSQTMRERALIYCGTPPVSADNTQGLLESPMHAIWYPPGARRVKPYVGDSLWLVWREAQGAPALILGAGKVRATAEGDVLWTARTAAGIRELAREYGYKGPSNMAFLRLERPLIGPANLSVSGLENVPSGLSEASEDQYRALNEALRLDASQTPA